MNNTFIHYPFSIFHIIISFLLIRIRVEDNFNHNTTLGTSINNIKPHTYIVSIIISLQSIGIIVNIHPSELYNNMNNVKHVVTNPKVMKRYKKTKICLFWKYVFTP